jgi:hypothetical protein
MSPPESQLEVEAPPGGAVEPGAGKGLVDALRRIRRRLVLDRLFRNAAADLLLSLSILVALLVADRVFFPGLVTLQVLGAVLLVSLAVSLARTVLLAPVSLLSAAVTADSRLRLKERVSSAMYRGGTDRTAGVEGRDGWGRLIEADATHALARVRLTEHFPVRPPRLLAWTLIPLAVLGIVSLYVPSFDVLGVGARKEASAKAKAAVEEKEKKLEEDLAALEKKAEERALEEAKKLLELLRQHALKRDLEPKDPAGEKKAEPGARDPKTEALVSMTRLEDEIKKAAEGKKLEPLKEAAKALKALDLKEADLTRKLREALKEGDFKKAKKALDDLKEEAASLAAKKPSEMTKEEKERLQKLADELGKLSSDSKALSKLSSALAKASSGLSAKDFPNALESLQMSGEELESLARLADEMDLLDQALELVKLSKEDLARLMSCPECGTPYCEDCGKPQCNCKPSQKPGGT